MKKQEKLCTRCLGHHENQFCKSRWSCRSCEDPSHHSLLCNDPRAGAVATLSITDDKSSSETKPSKTATHSSSSTCSVNNHPVYVRVVPLTADAHGKSMQIYALLDSGSDSTLATNRLASNLNLSGRKCSLHLEGVTNANVKNC